jgi:hypothetical protein
VKRLPVSSMQHCTTLRMNLFNIAQPQARAGCRASRAGRVALRVHPSLVRRTRGTSPELLSHRRLVPASALAHARHPQPARCHCSQGSVSLLPPVLGSCRMPTVTQFPTVTPLSDRPDCPKCGVVMMLARIVPAARPARIAAFSNAPSVITRKMCL